MKCVRVTRPNGRQLVSTGPLYRQSLCEGIARRQGKGLDLPFTPREVRSLPLDEVVRRENVWAATHAPGYRAEVVDESEVGAVTLATDVTIIANDDEAR